MKATMVATAAVCVLCVSDIAARQAGPTATPTLTPLAVTADSHPFGAAVGLAAMNYLEDEYVVSGDANVYGYDGAMQIAVATPDVPYAARMIVRRPADPARFNGTVVFELINSTPGFDTDIMWLYSRAQLMRDGYIYVGLSNTVEANAFSKAWDRP